MLRTQKAALFAFVLGGGVGTSCGIALELGFWGCLAMALILSGSVYSKLIQAMGNANAANAVPHEEGSKK